MTVDEFKKLERGDIVKSQKSGETYVIDANFGHRVTACTTKDLSNPDEWELKLKANHKRRST